jgi:ribosomal protein L40E
MKDELGKRDAVGLIYDELFLQPWFLPKPTYLALRRLLPSSQMAKMRYYFEDYGCLKCGGRDSLYASNGMCKRCSMVVRGRIVLSLKRRFQRVGAKVDRKLARRCLARLRQG